MTYSDIKSPGVYVREKKATPPISGVGTSTAGFIGVIENDQDTQSSSTSNNPTSSSAGEPAPEETDSAQDAPGDSSSAGETTPEETNSAQDASGENTSSSKNIPTAQGAIKLCTNFTEFKTAFWDSTSNAALSNLAHAVYGFFANGGTRCYVVYTNDQGVDDILNNFAAIDEIAIVAAPGADKNIQDKLTKHCADTQDRVAILDSPTDTDLSLDSPSNTDLTDSSSGGGSTTQPNTSEYAAYYFPWLQVSDLADSSEKKYVPPSGHIAGIYARVDAQRGVHKAPANEVVFGATGLQYPLSRAKQDGLNPQGVNCIRSLNGNIRVWGARTWGGEDNGVRYISTRRLLNYIRESIDEGTQWVVFEPNSPELWAKVRREVTAFLTMVWRSGALFGATPQEAFFVQCDAETNPLEDREQGRLIAKIGVAVVKPAEFVIFDLNHQWSGGN
jgi:hypothetical protein